MSAKSDLIRRLRYLSNALNNQAVIDVAIGLSEHNEVASLFRKGLGIVSFNIIEDFIKQRSCEALSFLSNSGIDFNNLTESLQNSSTYGALKALNVQARFVRKDPTIDLKNFLQVEAFNIYSTGIFPFTLSKFSFCYSNSSIDVSEISDLLRAFGISSGWHKLKEISDSIGGGIPDLSSAFSNASHRRNAAAHDASFNYTYSWLRNIKSEILALASALDIVLSARCRQVQRSPNKALDHSDIDEELNFRFLEEVSPALYYERKRIGGKVIRRWSSLPKAISGISKAILRRKEFLIVHDSTKRIMDWEV